MPWYIFGMGSNILFRMNRNMTWCLYRSKPGGARVSGDKWYVSSGAPMSLLSLMGLMGGTDLLDFTFCASA